MKTVLLIAGIVFFIMGCSDHAGADKSRTQLQPPDSISVSLADSAGFPVIDTLRYDSLQLHLVHGKPDGKWPVKSVYPKAGALLPFNRIVAYYGNFYSTGMGILGELPEDEMIRNLLKEAKEWADADTVIPTIPAIHYIAVTAQRNPGKGAKYRARMPASQIEKALELAKQINGIVFLDIQVGHSDLQNEIPALEEFLRLPNVHLAVDPEYSMKGGQVPSSTIGSFDAADINFAVDYLAQLVNEWDIPPKILVVHRFTQGMVTHARKIKTVPEVQVVMHMDGFGGPAKKIDSYRLVAREPVQFMGMKLFYKNDNAGGRLLGKKEVLDLFPAPVYIQYQ